MLLILIDNNRFIFPRFNLNIADKQGYLVFFVQAVPYLLGKFCNSSLNPNQLRFPFKAWQRVPIPHLGMDKMPLPGSRVLIGKSIAVTGFGVPIAAL